MRKKIRVLVVDDQSTVRTILQRGLSADAEIEIVGWANDAYSARDRIVQLEPDVVTLDVEMPRMSGLEFLRRLMPQYPLPVIMVSSLTGNGQSATFEALEAGAVDFVCKPQGGPGDLEAMLEELRSKVKVAAKIDRNKLRKTKSPVKSGNVKNGTTDASKKSLPGSIDLVAIGASTGGTLAVRELLSQLPEEMPGMIIVQHMPAGFTAMFAENLRRLTHFNVTEAKHGDSIQPGMILIAPGDRHVTVKRKLGMYNVFLSSTEKVQGHRPSVDVLLDSVANEAGSKAIGVLLTGMGSDGAKGLLRLRASGGRTIGQDEASSVVYGMPRVAFQIGAVEFQRSLDDIPGAILQIINGELAANDQAKASNNKD